MQKTNNKIGIGLGVVAAAATAAGVAAGYYFYASKNAKEHRRIAAKWAEDFKKDVVRSAKKVANINREALLSAIDTAAETYHSMRNIKREDVERAKKELKDNWETLLKEVSGETSRTKTAGKKTSSKPRRTSHAKGKRK